MDPFTSYLLDNDFSKYTIKQYLHVAKLFKEWHIKHTQLDPFDPTRVTSRDLQEFKHYLLTDARNKNNKKYNVSTIFTYIESLKAYFCYLEDNKVIVNNPAKRLKPPKLQSNIKTPKSLTEIERNRLLRVIEDPREEEKNRWRFTRNKAIVMLMLHAGLRVSEVSYLSLENIDLKHRLLTVFGKGKKFRYIPINKTLYLSLDSWLLERGQVDFERVFVSQKNNPLTNDGIQHVFRRLRKDTGISHLGPHVLRHTFAYDLVKKGTPINKVADLLGHSTVEVTRIYVTSHEKDLREYINRISDD